LTKDEDEEKEDEERDELANTIIDACDVDAPILKAIHILMQEIQGSDDWLDFIDYIYDKMVEVREAKIANAREILCNEQPCITKDVQGVLYVNEWEWKEWLHKLEDALR